MSKTKEVWITGIGMVSCFGEGADHHWQSLGSNKAPEPIINSENFAPYSVHPLPEMDWATQIPRKDQRQMETWQRLGTYCAGLALDDAGMKENEELVSTMDLVVCAGGGERDLSVDETILAESRSRNDRDMILNERLPVDLRPTLFLAQLSNLMAGNISIVHKVTGSSRTYMGEESAGITAIRDAVARVAHGQSSHVLVGGAYNAERPDLFLSIDLGHYAYSDSPVGVRERQKQGGGIIPGTAGAFLVFEEAEHAKKRGAKPYAKIGPVVSDLGERTKEATIERINGLLDQVNTDDQTAVISGATGAAGVTDWEIETLLAKLGEQAPIRSFHNMTGNPVEASFPFAISLAALALKNNAFYPPFEKSEQVANSNPQSILVSAIGHYRGEGFVKVEPAT